MTHKPRRLLSFTRSLFSYKPFSYKPVSANIPECPATLGLFRRPSATPCQPTQGRRQFSVSNRLCRLSQ